MCRKINTDYFICCERLSQGMWNEMSAFSRVSKQSISSALILIHNIHCRSGLSFFISVPSCPKCSLANISLCNGKYEKPVLQ